MIHREGGFSTVELMMALFVVALFTISSYQLFGLIISRSGEAREMSAASNLGYKILRKEGSQGVGAVVSCSASTPQRTDIEVSTPPAGLQNVSAWLESCRLNSSTTLTRVTSIVEWGNQSPKKRVSHAIYVSL